MNVINDHHDNLQNPKERLFDKDWLESISSGRRQSIRENGGDDEIEFAWDLKDEVNKLDWTIVKDWFFQPMSTLEPSRST